MTLGILRFFWGVPVFPGEPESVASARYQNEIDKIDLRLWIEPDNPSLLAAREEAWDLMWSKFWSQSQGLHSASTSAEEYQAAVEAAENPILPEQPSRIDYKAIRAQIPLLDWVSKWDEVKPTGRSWKARCPLHEDKRPSMHIYPEDNKWWCFVCNEGGDVIDYERARLNDERAVPTR